MRLFLALLLLLAICNCKLVLKKRNIGRAASPEPSLLTIQYAGSCVDFALIADTITINPINYNQQNLFRVAGSPSSPISGCLPFFTDATGNPRDYDNLQAHYFCANTGRNRATIEFAEVFNPIIYYYGQDLFGGDRTPFSPIPNVASPEACASICQTTAGCVGFAYTRPDPTPASNCVDGGSDYSGNVRNCYLKTSLEPLVNHRCSVSGRFGDEYTVPTDGFILGFRSDRPFRPISGKAMRRPTCLLADKFCSNTNAAVVTACRSNEVKDKKGWILNKDLVYVFPSSYPSPADCKSSTSCCSYLPEDTIGSTYLSNDNAFCVKPTNNDTFENFRYGNKNNKNDNENKKNDNNDNNISNKSNEINDNKESTENKENNNDYKDTNKDINVVEINNVKDNKKVEEEEEEEKEKRSN